jgi:hypothetical protein
VNVRPVLIVLAAAALACGGPAPQEAAVTDAPDAPDRVVLEAPWTELGWPPGPPWDVGAEVSGGMPTKDPTRDLDVHYRKPPGTPEEALIAWRDAALAKGWEVDAKYKADPLYVYLRRTGARVRVEADEHYGLVMRLDYDTKEVVLESWPSDPSCPEGTRRHPKPGDENGCYEVGTEMVEHGPWERTEDRRVVERGQLEHGVRVGTWTLDVPDPVEEDRYTVTREYAADGSYAETWVRRRDGARIASMAYDAERRPTGDWTWWNDDGTVAATYPYREGRLDPALYEQAFLGPLRTGFDSRFEVLDVDPVAGRVAYRTVNPPEGEVEPYDCGYGGMKEDPHSGVTLGLWSIDGPSVEEWVVYDVASAAEECTSEAVSKERLASAKARFAEVGLDPARKPAAVAATRSGDRWTVGAAGREIGLDAVTIKGAAPMTEHRDYVLGADDYGGYALGTWVGLDRPPLTFGFSRAMAGDGDLALTGSWEKDGVALIGWVGSYSFCCRSYGFVRVTPS